MAKIDEFYGTDLAHIGDYVVSASGDFDTLSGLANLKQALFHRLMTQPGSLVHRPSYGVGIKNFENSISTAANRSEISTRIREQFMQDPRVEEVNGVMFKTSDSRPDMTEILVRVKPKGYDEIQASFIPFGDVA